MWLGALVDAGAPAAAVEAAVAALGLGPVRLEWRRVRRGGIAATGVRVVTPAGDDQPRTWPEIRTILQAGALGEAVRARALGAFGRLAQAEARVHGEAPERVRLHEAGAVDALADIVGACAGVAALGLERLSCGRVALGSGTTQGRHGRLPVPGPAVVELLAGFPVLAGGVQAELCTPTGAALLAELARPGPLPPMTVLGQGFGAGSRELAHPNVLRLVLGDADPAPPGGPDFDRDDRERLDDAVVVEATVDDLSPELVPAVLDRLRAAGAHDAWATPVLMKKGRPGFTLTGLAHPGAVATLADVLFREATTLGCRWYPVTKHRLARRWVTVVVDGHELRVKLAEHGGVLVTAAPEYDDVRAAADATGRPLRAVYAEAVGAARAATSGL
jgi:hypothetical protein